MEKPTHIIASLCFWQTAHRCANNKYLFGNNEQLKIYIKLLQFNSFSFKYANFQRTNKEMKQIHCAWVCSKEVDVVIGIHYYGICGNWCLQWLTQHQLDRLTYTCIYANQIHTDDNGKYEPDFQWRKRVISCIVQVLCIYEKW